MAQTESVALPQARSRAGRLTKPSAITHKT